ncbi:MAG: ATP-binding cassette domain-containing protein, partial [Rhodospirillaceae bacterium]|nr:ATP-binding cassette domain-containing protein [Rhodospirillaceae bacterium]
LEQGGIRCIIGPNGAGKTTFISMISGHLRPTAGTVTFKGEDVTALPVAARARLGIGRKFQTPTVFLNLTVRENLELAALGDRLPPHKRAQRIDEVLGWVRLGDLDWETVSALSHGQRQWLEIGMLLANGSELLLLDEPTAGMTAEETHATAELVRRLSSTLGLTTIIIEHDIGFVRDLKADVTVLHLGRVLMEGPFDVVAADEQVRSVYLGNA